MVDSDQKLENDLSNLQFVNSELEKLHQLCVDSDLDPFQTFQVAKPLLKWHRKTRTHGWRVLVTVAVMIALTGFFIENNKDLKRYVSAVIRNFNVKLIPWITWTGISRTRCLIPNPFADIDLMEPDKEDCPTCFNMTAVRQFEEIELEKLCDTYLHNDIPIVLNNQNVYRSGRKTFQDIIEMYLEDEKLNLYKCCDFSTNKHNVQKDHRIFLNKLKNGKISQFYAHWQNCFTEAAKLFRKVYNRPTLLPSTVEISAGNWVFLSSDYVEDQPIEMPINSSVIILIQIYGNLDVIADPKPICENQCSVLSVQLQPQSILIAPTYLYTYKYIPSKVGPSITVGLEGTIDLY